MMSFIETLLVRNEDKTLEFKRDLSSPKSILKTLVAFANTAGGTLIIGIGLSTFSCEYGTFLFEAIRG